MKKWFLIEQNFIHGTHSCLQRQTHIDVNVFVCVDKTENNVGRD